MNMDEYRETNDKIWLEHYELLMKYFNYYHTGVKVSFITFDGINYDENGFKLGSWFHIQKTAYRRGTLDSKRKKLLMPVFKKSKCNRDWDFYYNLVRNYYNTYKLPVPSGFKTFDGVNYDEDGYLLGSWLKNQKRDYKAGVLKKDRLDKIKDILDIDSLERSDRIWNNNYQLLCSYVSYYKALPKRTFKTVDGIHFDERGFSLGEWAANCRANYEDHKLSEKKRLKYEELLRYKSNDDAIWDKKYDFVLNYFLVNKEPIPSYYVGSDGVQYGMWYAKQKQYYRQGKLTNERTRKIKYLIDIYPEISKDEAWLMHFNDLKKYYQINMDLPGVNYRQDSGFYLGKWWRHQLDKYTNNKIEIDKLQYIKEIYKMLDEINKREETRWVSNCYMLVLLLMGMVDDTESLNIKTIINWFSSQLKLYKNNELQGKQKEIFAGLLDNIYGDTYSESEISKNVIKLIKKQEY